ncbi:3-oxosteroid 1-dehydrogenase, partial [Fusarium beomiforme]
NQAMPPRDQEMTCAAAHEDFGHHQAPSHQRTSVIKCDILIIGAGAAGLAAAAAAHDPGLRVILAEKEDHVGGTTFRSGGCMWMPDNFLMREAGIQDNKEQAARYINAVAKLTCSNLEEQAFHGRLRDERLDAFLTQGPEMMRYFRDQGFRWMAKPSQFPDYHPHIEEIPSKTRWRTRDPQVRGPPDLDKAAFIRAAPCRSFGSPKGHVEACVDGSITGRPAPQGVQGTRQCENLDWMGAERALAI